MELVLWRFLDRLLGFYTTSPQRSDLWTSERLKSRAPGSHAEGEKTHVKKSPLNRWSQEIQNTYWHKKFNDFFGSVSTVFPLCCLFLDFFFISNKSNLSHLWINNSYIAYFLNRLRTIPIPLHSYRSTIYTITDRSRRRTALPAGGISSLLAFAPVHKPLWKIQKDGDV